MCHSSNSRNPFHCIVPPYMVEQIVNAGEDRRSLFAASVQTRFNDELFRKKRAVLTEMSGKEMKQVVSTAALAVASAISAPAKKSAAKKSTAKKTASKKSALHPNRKIYDANNDDDQRKLPGKLIRKEGQKPVKDKDVNNIYDNCGFTWDFYYNAFKRNSIDNKGLPLINTVHFGDKFGNAFWEGAQMVYGDGDEVFKSFTQDIDITGHELTHGVVQYEAMLVYEFESGAINESMADIFGIMVRQFALKEGAKTSDWLIGRSCMKGTGYALRSMKNPGNAYKNHPILGNDPQPGHMKDFRKLPNTRSGDYGGVHINSGITNHAFYLAAYELGGYAWEKAGRIWYEALCDAALLNAQSKFADLSQATISKAETLFGINSRESQVVKKAWKDVGL